MPGGASLYAVWAQAAMGRAAVAPPSHRRRHCLGCDVIWIGLPECWVCGKVVLTRAELLAKGEVDG